MRSVGYDTTASKLEIEFWDADVYEYGNVPANVYAELLASNSVGRYFNSNILRNPACTCRQVA